MTSIDPLAVVDLTCPFHTDQVLMTWLSYERDGKRRLHSDAPREMVTGRDDGDVAVWGDRYDEAVTMAPPADTDAPAPGKGRFRVVVECPRLTCGYELQIALRKVRGRVDRLLQGMEAQGIARMSIADIDKDTPKVVGRGLGGT